MGLRKRLKKTFDKAESFVERNRGAVAGALMFTPYGLAVSGAGGLGALGTGGAVGMAAGGSAGYGIVDQPAAEGRRAQEDLDAKESAIEAEIAQRNANVSRLRGLFGVGDSPDALKNRQSLSDAINAYYNQVLQQGLGEAEQGFSNTSRTTRQNLARVGQLGSGLDASAQTGTLSDFIRARQRAISNAGGARDSLSGSLTSQRLGWENQLSSGASSNPNFDDYAAQRDSTLRQAQSSIVPQQLGKLFSAAGQTYFNGRVNEAQGNQGLQAFGFSGSNPGRLS